MKKMIALPEKIKYVLVRQRGIGNLQGDFNTILSQLGTYSGIGLTNHGDGQATISYTEGARKATLSMPKRENAITDVGPSQQMTLICERKDNVAVNLLRNVVDNIGYRVFNPELQSYLPNDTNLMDVTTLDVDEKIQAIFEKLNFTPLFNYRNSLIYYAKPKKGKGIYLINRHLLQHFTEKGVETENLKEFSVKVAPDINRFIALQDRGIIPVSFYKYFNKPSKIINLSGFDEKKLESSIVVQHNLFEFVSSKQSFRNKEMVKANATNHLKKGQSIKNYITKFLDDLELDSNFLAAKVATDINYQKQKDGSTLPRLHLSIFLDESPQKN